MFSGSKKIAHQELEAMCIELTQKFDKKQHELDQKERQVQHLTKNLRKWQRKYHEMEMSVSENVIDHPELDNEEDESIKKLKAMLLKLNAKNVKLEKRIAKMQSFIDEVNASDDSETADRIEIEVRRESEPTDTKTSYAFGEDRVVPEEPEFSPEMQALLAKHAAEANSATAA